MRKEAIAVLDRSRTISSVNSLRSRVATYERVIEQLEEKDELTTQEKQMLEVLPATLATWKEQLAEAEESEESKDKGDEPKGPSEKAIAAQIESMIKSKMRIASISTNGSAVFVATRAKTGYGFAVWKLDKALTGGEEIVTNLSGCCGQMDVQANENGLFVAENSRKRVVFYDANGDEIRAWGKADRTGLDGFTSCCNPMNVCFNAAGDVFTAESNTGRIKRFSADGEFLNFVGDVKLVPGCKNVSIAVTPDHSKVFMLDITRNHIVVMEAKSESKSKPGEKASTSTVTLSK
jgi:hypothetical protein